MITREMVENLSETLMTAAVTRCFGALALELAPASLAGRLSAPQARAADLAAHVAVDLGRHVASSAAVQLTVLAAHFDPVEVLRPGWPLHCDLAEFGARAPGPRDEARVVAFGSHDRVLPAALTPDANFVGGPLRLVPWVLSGDAATLTPLADELEATLLETGMAGAATALLAQELFDARIEHARYLTVHDLVALMALQYEHAGLAGLWPLIESALLAPQERRWLDAPPEPLLHLVDGRVRMATLDIDAWADAGLAPEHTTPDHLASAYAAFCARQRQFTALLSAHRIDLDLCVCSAGRDPRGLLRG